MPEAIRRANNIKSKVRSRVEHVFAKQKSRMGLFIRTISIARPPPRSACQSRIQHEAPDLPRTNSCCVNIRPNRPGIAASGDNQGVSTSSALSNSAKSLGDGVLAYFPQQEADAAVAAALDILHEMNRRRRRAPGTSPQHLLYGGVGLANGMVYEGNIGSALKLDFTILGNTVNLASRLESLTRELNVPLIAAASVTHRARNSWAFQSLGSHKLKGQLKGLEIFGLKSLDPLPIDDLYRQIAEHLSSK